MKYSIALSSLLFAISPTVFADTHDATNQRITQLEQQLTELKTQVKTQEETEKSAEPSIKIGGAVRFQYSYEDYNEENRDRVGDLDFDVFRLDVNGTIGDVSVSAQYRWYQYMDVIHHAYVGYKFDEEWQGQLGITQVPFGVLDYNSNSFFFSSGYYVGLEDDFDAGISFIRKSDNHDLRLAFFKNDEQGGIDGYVGDRTDRYSYDVIGITDGEEMAESNTFNVRYAYNFSNTEVGLSLQHGDLAGRNDSLGSHSAYAIHVKSQIENIGVMFQFSDYEYDLDDGSETVSVGAYSFSDNIPAEAKLYNFNLSYSMDVDMGPVTNLKFYNDFNLMTDKSGDYDNDTVMNVVGVAVSAGGIYSYIDLITAKNQPFIGGSMANDNDDWNTRFNINVGYYF
jgi:hypothetical protein